MAKCAKSTFLIPLVAVLLLTSPEASAHAGASDSNADLHSRGLILVKIWCLIIMFVSTFAGGVSPYFWRWHEGFLLLGTQFSGGVFLGTALMHFLSDSAATFGKLTPKEYPFAYMLAAAGYLLTMMGDCVIAHVVSAAARGRNEVRSEVDDGTAPPADMEAAHGGAFLVNTTSVGDTVLLILALCFHSIFEGIAVGVAATKGDAWRNMWTISLHKVFAAVAMGIALLKMIPKRPFLITVAYSLAFAISSPVGTGIGIALDATTEGHTADWTYAIAMGLACGVFMYVAINHLMAKGFRPQAKCYLDSPFYKLWAVLLGVGVIAIVMIWD